MNKNTKYIGVIGCEIYYETKDLKSMKEIVERDTFLGEGVKIFRIKQVIEIKRKE